MVSLLLVRKFCSKSILSSSLKLSSEFISALKLCCETRDLQYGKRIHRRIKELQLDEDLDISFCLVNMYVKCSEMHLAGETFDRMQHKDVFTWNVVILGYVENGKALYALELFHVMDCEPNDVTYVAALKACAGVAHDASERQKALEVARNIEKQVGESFNIVILNSLINVYSKCGSILQARHVFERMKRKDVFTWTSLLVGYVENGKSDEALKLFAVMDCKPSRVTLICMVRACTNLASMHLSEKQTILERAVEVHRQLKQLRQDSDVLVGSMLLNMYSKCKCMTLARDVFNAMKQKDVVAWNCLMQAYIDNAQSLTALHVFKSLDCKPSPVTFVTALKACASVVSEDHLDKSTLLEEATCIHREVTKHELQTNASVVSMLVYLYSKLGEINLARESFERLANKDVVAWNCMILAYVDSGDNREALDLFFRMICQPDHVTCVGAIKACSGLAAQEADDEGKRRALDRGICIHRLVNEQGFSSDGSVASSLICMYCRCAAVHLAREVFESMNSKDVVIWNCLLQGYVENQEYVAALELIEKMDCCEPNRFTFVTVLKACSGVAGEEIKTQAILKKGVELHEKMKLLGLESDIHIANSLIRLYGKCKSIALARDVFETMSCRDVVTWNTLILGYVDNGESRLALDVFSAMDCAPNHVTFLAVIKACTFLATTASQEVSQRKSALEKAISIHKQLREFGYESNVGVASMLIKMYGKFQMLELAEEVFEIMSCKDVVLWNCLMVGCTENGRGSVALDLFRRMDCAADHVTYATVLKACKSIAALAYGRTVHGEVCRLGLENDAAIATTLVDMYAACGCMDLALEVFNSVSRPRIITWTALVAGYSSLGDSRRVFGLAEEIQEAGVKMNGITFVCLLAACSHAGMVEDGEMYFGSMQKHGVKTTVEHYNCLVDMLARANKLDEAADIFNSMAPEANEVTWTTLLGASSKWNLEDAKAALDSTEE